MSTGNTYYGTNALSSNNVTSSYSSAFGYNALQDSVSVYNTAVGAFSGANSTTGQSNVSLGTNSLLSNTSGSYNTALGTATMCFNVTGSNNTAVGSNALENSTNSSFNTAVGAGSMTANVSGSGNVAVGTGSLYSNIQSNMNTAVGVSSLKNSTGSNNTGVGANASLSTTSGNNNVSLGANSMYKNTDGSNNTSVGYNASNSNIHGSNNTSLGYLAGYNDTGSQNTFIGALADSSAAGITNSTAIGYNAKVSGSHQVVLGTSSEEVVIPGTLNVAGVTTFTGIPSAPTAPYGTNNSQVATTAFVQSALNTTPVVYFYYAQCTGTGSGQHSGQIILNNGMNSTNYAVFTSIYYGYTGSGGTYDALGSSSAIRTVIVYDITETQFLWIFQNDQGDNLNVYITFMVYYNSGYNYPKVY